jgi:hypothetical protein
MIQNKIDIQQLSILHALSDPRSTFNLVERIRSRPGDTNRPESTAGSGEVERSAASVDRLTVPNSRTDPA